MRGSPGQSHSTVSQGHIIDFEKAELRRPPFQDALYLWVRGRLPATGLDVRLAPRIYHGRPDYWGIEVAAVTSTEPANDTGHVKTDNGDSLVFERSVPLAGIMGVKGVAVIGASRFQQIDIDGGS